MNKQSAVKKERHGWVRPLAVAAVTGIVLELVAAIAYSVILFWPDTLLSSNAIPVALSLTIPLFLFDKGSTFLVHVLPAYLISAVVTIPLVWYLTCEKEEQ